MGANGSILTLRDNMVTLINNQNSVGATYDISASLTRRVVTVEAGIPEKSQALTQIPCVLVHVPSYTDEWAYLGNTHKRTISYTIDIYAATNVISTLPDAIKENMQLTDNLTNLFRHKYNLSMTSFWVDEVSVENFEVEPATYQKINKISLRGHEIA